MVAKLIFIAMDGCPHCIRFDEVWSDLQQDEELKDMIEFIKYDMNEDYPNQYKQFTTNGYPTIILDIDGKQLIPYNKGRTLEQVKIYINSMVDKKNGGASKNDEEYKVKYLKYKAKYLKLKSSQF